MKDILSKALFLSLVASLAACSEECPDLPDVQNEVPVTFSLKFIDMPDVSTRSLAPGYKFSDGKSVNLLRCYVYNRADGSSASPAKIVDIPVKDMEDKRGGEFSISLPKGESYDFVFLGTSIEPSYNRKLYYNSTDRTLTLNYSMMGVNDEETDCFYAVSKEVSTDSPLSLSVELTRPLAQINIGTKDYEKYTETHPVRDIQVNVDKVYSTLNLMTGKLSGTYDRACFGHRAIPEDQTFPVDGVKYLAMVYVLADTRTLVSVEMTVNHSDGSESKTVPFGDVAIERNYQTNIYGKTILTDYPKE